MSDRKTETTITREIFVQTEKGKRQDAKITFVNGGFDKCDYHVEKLSYSLEDWRFLRRVAEIIETNVQSEKAFFDRAMGK